MVAVPDRQQETLLHQRVNGAEHSRTRDAERLRQLRHRLLRALRREGLQQGQPAHEAGNGIGILVAHHPSRGVSWVKRALPNETPGLSVGSSNFIRETRHEHRREPSGQPCGPHESPYRALRRQDLRLERLPVQRRLRRPGARADALYRRRWLPQGGRPHDAQGGQLHAQPDLQGTRPLRPRVPQPRDRGKLPHPVGGRWSSAGKSTARSSRSISAPGT